MTHCNYLRYPAAPIAGHTALSNLPSKEANGISRTDGAKIMACWKSNAKKQFDSWSRGYDRSILQKIFFKPSHDKLLSIAKIQEGSRILDIGCGTGLFARRIAVEYPNVEVVGLDLSEGMLLKARANCAGLDQIRLVQGDSEHLPFESNSFDLVTCVHSFHHYPHQALVVREMFRVLKPDGQLLIVDGNRDQWWGWLVFDLVVTTIEGMVHHCSAKQFASLYEAAGIEVGPGTKGGWLAPFLVMEGYARKSVARQTPLRKAA
jgi:ubiquinone/menaquinone biosynthesis C-methylase UbiE